MTVEIQIEGMDKVLKRLSEPRMREEMSVAMKESVHLMHYRMAIYPAPPPNSTYRRTGYLGRSWYTNIRSFSGDIQGYLANRAPYKDYVQGLEQTAQHEATGWKRIDREYQAAKSAILQLFKDALNRVARGG